MLQVPASGLSAPQLRVLAEELGRLFGPAGDRGAYLSELMTALSERGLQLSKEAVVRELEVASSAEYDARPQSERWGVRLFWDPTDESICAL